MTELELYKKAQKLKKTHIEKNIIGLFNAFGIVGLVCFSVLGILILMLSIDIPIIPGVIDSVGLSIVLLSSALMKNEE